LRTCPDRSAGLAGKSRVKSPLRDCRIEAKSAALERRVGRRAERALPAAANDRALTGFALLLPESVPDFPLVAVIGAGRSHLWRRPGPLKRHFDVSASIETHRPLARCCYRSESSPSGRIAGTGRGCWTGSSRRCLRPALCVWRTDNERNVPFYLRHGFAVTSEYLTHGGGGVESRRIAP